MRTMCDNVYHLNQECLIETIHGQWGPASATLAVHDHDKIRLFGILMSLEKNKPQFPQLAKVATEDSQ